MLLCISLFLGLNLHLQLHNDKIFVYVKKVDDNLYFEGTIFPFFCRPSRSQLHLYDTMYYFNSNDRFICLNLFRTLIWFTITMPMKNPQNNEKPFAFNLGVLLLTNILQRTLHSFFITCQIENLAYSAQFLT